MESVGVHSSVPEVDTDVLLVGDWDVLALRDDVLVFESDEEVVTEVDALGVRVTDDDILNDGVGGLMVKDADMVCTGDGPLIDTVSECVVDAVLLRESDCDPVCDTLEVEDEVGVGDDDVVTFAVKLWDGEGDSWRVRELVSVSLDDTDADRDTLLVGVEVRLAVNVWDADRDAEELAEWDCVVDSVSVIDALPLDVGVHWSDWVCVMLPDLDVDTDIEALVVDELVGRTVLDSVLDTFGDTVRVNESDGVVVAEEEREAENDSVTDPVAFLVAVLVVEAVFDKIDRVAHNEADIDVVALPELEPDALRLRVGVRCNVLEVEDDAFQEWLPLVEGVGPVLLTVPVVSFDLEVVAVSDDVREADMEAVSVLDDVTVLLWDEDEDVVVDQETVTECESVCVSDSE